MPESGTLIVLSAINLSVGLLVFATGLNASVEDVTFIWKRPKALARAFLAMYVLVPLAAVVFALMFELPRETKLALLLISVSAGTPLFPKQALGMRGDLSYAFSLAVATSAAAILTVPISVALLQPLLPQDMQVAVSQVFLTLLRSFLLPFLGGMACRRQFPAWSSKLGDPLMRIAGVVLAIASALVMAAHWRDLLALGLPTVMDFVLLTVAALGVGHWLGGANESRRNYLAVACSARNISLALLIAGNVQSPTVLALVAAYLFASLLVCKIYLLLRTRVVRGLVHE